MLRPESLRAFRLHLTRPLPSSWPCPVPLALHPHWFLGWPCCLSCCRALGCAGPSLKLFAGLPCTLPCPSIRFLPSSCASQRALTRTTVCSYLFFLFIFSNVRVKLVRRGCLSDVSLYNPRDLPSAFLKKIHHHILIGHQATCWHRRAASVLDLKDFRGMSKPPEGSRGEAQVGTFTGGSGPFSQTWTLRLGGGAGQPLSPLAVLRGLGPHGSAGRAAEE